MVGAICCGKLVACPSELGYVVLGLADREDTVARARRIMSAGGSRNSELTLVCGEPKDAEQYWLPGTCTEDIRRFLAVFWPGAMRVSAFASSRVPRGICEGHRKVSLWIPWNHLCRAAVRNCSHPLFACVLAHCFADGSTRGLARLRSLAGMEGGDTVDFVVESCADTSDDAEAMLDISGPEVRVCKSGSLDIAIARSLLSRPLILSDDRLYSSHDAWCGGARVVLVDGEEEHVLKRIRSLVAEQDLSPETVEFFVHSSNLLEALAGLGRVSSWCDELLPGEELQPFYWQNQGYRLWERVRKCQANDTIRCIVVQGVAGLKGAEALRDRLAFYAQEIINADGGAVVGYSSNHWEDA